VPVYVVCQSGGRSSRACELLLDADVTNVVNVAGGTMGYAALGNPLNVGETP
jgi:rhodanese-related sulfurtransferase